MLRWSRKPRPPRHPVIPPDEHVEVRENPFDRDENARSDRNRTAASLVDDETYGYIVLRLHRSKGQLRPEAHIEVSGYLLPVWWVAFRATLLRVIDASEELFPD
jgi:hypothetical protein